MRKKAEAPENRGVEMAEKASGKAVIAEETPAAEEPKRNGRLKVVSSSHYRGKAKGWEGLRNLSEFNEFIMTLGLTAGDVARKLEAPAQNVTRWFAIDDAYLGNVMKVATLYDYRLFVEYRLTDRQICFERSGAVELPRLKREEMHGKKLLFLRKALQLSGNTVTDLAAALGLGRTSVQHWLIIDDIRFSYMKRIAEVMGWKLSIKFKPMTAKERKEMKQAPEAIACPEVKDVFDLGGKEVSAADRKFLEKLRKALDAHISEQDFSAERLAKRMNTETHLLHARLMGLLGLGTANVIEAYRLDSAAAILKEGGCTCREVTRRVGFSSAPNFSKNFKSRYGITPGNFAIQSSLQNEAEGKEE